MVANILGFLKESLTTLREIAQLSLAIRDIVKANPRFFIIVFSLIAVYIALNYYTYAYPSRVIKTFYTSIGEKKVEEAWKCLGNTYRSRRWRHKKEFAQLYSTSNPYTNLAVVFKGSTWNPLSHIFSRALKFSVSFEVHEHFTRRDLLKTGQLENRLWVQIYHKRDYPKLMNGTIGKEKFGGNPSLALRRYFKKVVVVRKGSDGWKIASIHVIERGLRPLQSNDQF